MKNQELESLLNEDGIFIFRDRLQAELERLDRFVGGKLQALGTSLRYLQQQPSHVQGNETLAKTLADQVLCVDTFVQQTIPAIQALVRAYEIQTRHAALWFHSSCSDRPLFRAPAALQGFMQHLSVFYHSRMARLSRPPSTPTPPLAPTHHTPDSSLAPTPVIPAFALAPTLARTQLATALPSSILKHTMSASPKATASKGTQALETTFKGVPTKEGSATTAGGVMAWPEVQWLAGTAVILVLMLNLISITTASRVLAAVCLPMAVGLLVYQWRARRPTSSRPGSADPGRPYMLALVVCGGLLASGLLLLLPFSCFGHDCADGTTDHLPSSPLLFSQQRYSRGCTPTVFRVPPSGSVQPTSWHLRYEMPNVSTSLATPASMYSWLTSLQRRIQYQSFASLTRTTVTDVNETVYCAPALWPCEMYSITARNEEQVIIKAHVAERPSKPALVVPVPARAAGSSAQFVLTTDMNNCVAQASSLDYVLQSPNYEASVKHGDKGRVFNLASDLNRLLATPFFAAAPLLVHEAVYGVHYQFAMSDLAGAAIELHVHIGYETPAAREALTNAQTASIVLVVAGAVSPHALLQADGLFEYLTQPPPVDRGQPFISTLILVAITMTVAVTLLARAYGARCSLKAR